MRVLSWDFNKRSLTMGKMRSNWNMRVCVCVCVCVCVSEYSATQLCPALWDHMDCSLPGSSVHGILQVRILEWVAMPSSRGSFQPKDWTHVSCIAGRFGTAESLGKPHVCVCVLYVCVCVCVCVCVHTHRERMDFCNSQACALPIDLISLPDIILVHPCKFNVWHIYPGEIDDKKVLVDKWFRVAIMSLLFFGCLILF